MATVIAQIEGDAQMEGNPVQTAADMPETDAARLLQDTLKPAWHAPVITRIDIKRTMFGEGYFTDDKVATFGPGAI